MDSYHCGILAITQPPMRMNSKPLGTVAGRLRPVAKARRLHSHIKHLTPHKVVPEQRDVVIWVWRSSSSVDKFVVAAKEGLASEQTDTIPRELAQRVRVPQRGNEGVGQSVHAAVGVQGPLAKPETDVVLGGRGAEAVDGGCYPVVDAGGIHSQPGSCCRRCPRVDTIVPVAAHSAQTTDRTPHTHQSQQLVTSNYHPIAGLSADECSLVVSCGDHRLCSSCTQDTIQVRSAHIIAAVVRADKLRDGSAWCPPPPRNLEHGFHCEHVLPVPLRTDLRVDLKRPVDAANAAAHRAQNQLWHAALGAIEEPSQTPMMVGKQTAEVGPHLI
jgi:hypothetical protein